MAQKPLPDQSVILEALFDEAKRYINDFGPIVDKLLLLEQKKPDGCYGSPVRSPWDFNFQKALIDDIRKRLVASSGGLIALSDYFESDLLTDFADFYSRTGGMDPNSDPSKTIIVIAQQTLEKVRALYRKIIAKLENQKTTSPTALLIPDTPRRHSPAVSPEGDTRSSDAPTDRSHQGFMAIETSPFAETIRRLKRCPSQAKLVRYLWERRHEGVATLDQVATEVFGVRVANLHAGIKDVRRQVGRTRDNLDKRDCPLRLVVAANTVQLTTARPPQGLPDSDE